MKKVLFASEIPTPHLADCWEYVDYNFIIATMYLEDPKYREYYYLMRKHFTILDNGAFETGESISTDLYFKIVKELNPNMIVIPDVRHDYTATLIRSSGFLKQLPKEFPKKKLMGVLQGNSWLDYENMLEFYKQEDVKLIGIPYGKIDRVSFIRSHFDIAFHVLGLPYISELISLRLLSNILSLDTSLPVKFAAQEHKMSQMLSPLTIDERPEYNKPLSDPQVKILKSNLKFISHLCDRDRIIKIKGW